MRNKKFLLFGVLFAIWFQFVSAFGQNPYQQAYDFGYWSMRVTSAKISLAYGNYQVAYRVFEEASRHNVVDAFCYLAVCYELGMGTSVDRNQAYRLYALASQYGNADGYAALRRIKNEGFWSATNQQRTQFCNNLKIQLESRYGRYPGGGNVDGSDNYHDPDYDPYKGRRCAGCSGTGQCTMCKGKGGYWLNVGMYTGKDLKEWTTCSGCHGSGNCAVCYGKGWID